MIHEDEDRWQRIRGACCDGSVIDCDEQARLVERAVIHAGRLREALEVGGYTLVLVAQTLAEL